MRCPSCNSLDTQVKDSRPTEDSAVIRRRRIAAESSVGRESFTWVSSDPQLGQRIGGPYPPQSG